MATFPRPAGVSTIQYGKPARRGLNLGVSQVPDHEEKR